MVVVMWPRIGLGLILLLVVGACSAIAGLRDLQYVASSESGDDAGRSEDADAAPVCALPALGTAAIRVGDFLPSTARYAVCIHRTDGTTALDDVALPGAGGSGCPGSFGFADVLAPIGLPPGSYDVNVVAAGADCASPALASARGVSLVDGTTTALYLLEGTESVLSPFPETASFASTSSLRFIDVVVDGGPLDFGLAAGATMPTTLLGPFFTGVAYGDTGAPWSGAPYTIDANGYVQVDFRTGNPAYGVAPSGQKALSRLIKQTLSASHGYTVFAAGSSTDPLFPLELVMCDEGSSTGAFTSCGEIVDVRVAAYDPYMVGPLGPLVSVRQQAAIEATAQLNADVVCVGDLYPYPLRQTLASEAAQNYRYSVYFHDTLSTPVDDPTTQDGGIPSPPTSPPCAPSDSALESFVACAQSNCSTIPNSMSGSISAFGVDCLTNNCYAQSGALAIGEPTCWSCALADFESGATWSTLETDCEQNPQAGLAFEGDVGTIILSRFPVLSSDQFVLPGTQWRIAVSRAVLAVGTSTTLDFYCAVLDVPYTGPTHPYVGQYGGGATASDGEWAAEQLLQAQKLVAYVDRSSVELGRRAILAGNFEAGGSWAAQSITGVSAATTFAELNTFPLATTPGYVPQCTTCAANPITTPPGSALTAASTWTVFSLLANIPTTDVTSSGVVLDQPLISVEPPEGGAPYEIPASPNYGYQATIRVRP